jgi:hypothetical protein
VQHVFECLTVALAAALVPKRELGFCSHPGERRAELMGDLG